MSEKPGKLLPMEKSTLFYDDPEVAKFARQECSKVDAIEDGCEVNKKKQVGQDESGNTCVVLSYFGSDFVPKTKQVCSPLLNPLFQKYEEMKLAKQEGVNAYEKQFKDAMKELKKFPDVTQKMINEYMLKRMREVQKINTDALESANFVYKNEFVQRVLTYIKCRRSLPGYEAKEAGFIKTYNEEYEKAKQQFMVEHGKNRTYNVPMPLDMELKFKFAEEFCK
ncbi:hypothetical protein KKA47_03250 [bacterium]|nr:hypothetical protein [bacterium]